MKYRIELEKDQVLLIGSALVMMPYGQVVQLIAELQKQVQEQEQSNSPNNPIPLRK